MSGRWGQAPQTVARNSIGRSFNKVRKRCNSNDLNSMSEIVAGELRAKLGMASAMPQARTEHDTRAVGQAAAPVGGGGAWPGFETTPRRRLAARTASGRAAAHGHTKQPGPTGAEGAGGTGEPGRGAGGQRRSLVGLRDDAQAHVSTQGPTGVEGTGGTGGPGGGARGRWRGLAGLRDDAPSKARGADGSRAGRRPRAQPAARPDSTPRGARNTRGATSNQPGNPRNTNARQPERATARSRSQ